MSTTTQQQTVLADRLHARIRYLEEKLTTTQNIMNWYEEALTRKYTECQSQDRIIQLLRDQLLSNGKGVAS